MEGRIRRCCKRHPEHPVVGVCSSCLRERLLALTLLDLDNETTSVQLPSQISNTSTPSSDQHTTVVSKSADSSVKHRLRPSSSSSQRRQRSVSTTSADMAPVSADLQACHATTNPVRHAAKRKQLSLQVNDYNVDMQDRSNVQHTCNCNLPPTSKKPDVQIAVPNTAAGQRQNMFAGPAAALSNTKCTCLRRHHSLRRAEDDVPSQSPAAVVLDQAPFSPSLMSTTISYEDHRTSYDILFTGNLVQDTEGAGSSTRPRHASLSSRKSYRKKLSRAQNLLFTSSPLQALKQGRRSCAVDESGRPTVHNKAADHHCSNPADQQIRRSLQGFVETLDKTNNKNYRSTKCGPAPMSAARTEVTAMPSHRFNNNIIDRGAGVVEDFNGVMMSSCRTQQPQGTAADDGGSSSWFNGLVNHYKMRRQRRTRSKSIAAFSSTANAAYNLCSSPDILYPLRHPSAGRHSIDCATASRRLHTSEDPLYGEGEVELDSQLRKKFASLFDGASDLSFGTCSNGVSDTFKIDKQVQVDEPPAVTQRMKLANFLASNVEDDQGQLIHLHNHFTNRGNGTAKNVVHQNNSSLVSLRAKSSNECQCPSPAAAAPCYTCPLDSAAITSNINSSWMGFPDECLNGAEGSNGGGLKGPSTGSSLLKGCSNGKATDVNSMLYKCGGASTAASKDPRHEMIPPVRASSNNVNIWRKIRVMTGFVKSSTTSSKLDIADAEPSEHGPTFSNSNHTMQSSGNGQSKSSNVDNHRTDRVYFSDRYVETDIKSADDDTPIGPKEQCPPVNGFNISCNSSPCYEMPQYSVVYSNTHPFNNHHRHAVEVRSSPETDNFKSVANSFWTKDYSAFSFYFSPLRRSGHQKNYLTANANNSNVTNNQHAYLAGHTHTAVADDQFSRILFCHRQVGSSSSSRRSVDGSSCGFMKTASTCT